MENIKTKDISDLLIRNEWLVLFINADWCKHCEETKKHIPEIVSNTPDITIVGISAQDPDNVELLKGINFETLPYFSVLHSKKEYGNPLEPMTCFVGGDAGNHNILIDILSMIRLFKIKDLVK